MSLLSKTKFMKSTLKIAFQSNMSPELPVIKFVQPIEQRNGNFNPTEDNDPKDEMLKAFLSLPASTKNYPMFSVATTFPHPFENPTHWITTIAPVKEEELLYKLRHMVLNRFVPYDTIVELNSMSPERLVNYFRKDLDNKEIYYEGAEKFEKIHAFFDWLDALSLVEEQAKELSGIMHQADVSGLS